MFGNTVVAINVRMKLNCLLRNGDLACPRCHTKYPETTMSIGPDNKNKNGTEHIEERHSFNFKIRQILSQLLQDLKAKTNA